MKLLRIVLAAATLAAIPALASAQQPLKGTIVTIDRLSGTIGIQQPQTGTVGAPAAAPSNKHTRRRQTRWRNCTPATGSRSPSAKSAARRRSRKSRTSRFSEAAGDEPLLARAG